LIGDVVELIEIRRELIGYLGIGFREKVKGQRLKVFSFPFPLPLFPANYFPK